MYNSCKGCVINSLNEKKQDIIMPTTTSSPPTNNTRMKLFYTKLLRSSLSYCNTNFECAICYQSIQKKMFVCSAPCNKIFHSSCLEKQFQQTTDSAYEEYIGEPIFKCCYCRRTTNINVFCMELFIDNMVSLQNSRCFFTQDVIDDLRYKIKYDPDGEFREDYQIYSLHCTRFFKKPKQSKRTEIGNKLKSHKKMPRVAVKQRINRNR